MNHLTALELVELLDGELPPERAAHTHGCAMCRAQVDQLRTTLTAAADDVPEPSPLFWDHFSSQVRDRIAGEQVQSGVRARLARWPRTVLATCAAAALVIVIGIAGGILRSPAHPPVERIQEDLAAEEAWAAVRAAAENVSWEDAHRAGIAAQPAAAEQAIGGLSERERRELMRLIEEEIKRAGA